MGNATVHDNSLCYNFRAHNFKVDPEALDIVVASGIPLTVITTPVAKQSHFTPEDFARLAATGLQEYEYLAKSAAAGRAFMGYDVSFLYDPLVVHQMNDSSSTELQTIGTTSVTTGISAPIRDAIFAALH
jgi:inosine-uridine nucleoside N-ribohydrolase